MGSRPSARRTKAATPTRAGLYFLVATCEAHGVNPLAYLKDVLIRVQSHPHSRIDELLPDRWREIHGRDSS